MPDVRIIQDTGFPALAVTLDWLLLPNGTLDDTQALVSAVIVALGTDRLADVSDILPDPDSTDRRGWWGDLDADSIWGGWPIGSRIWLETRDKIVDAGARQGATVARVAQYFKESLQPFVDQRIVSSFELEVARNPYNRSRIDTAITFFRALRPAVDLRFEILWDDLRS